MNQKVVLWLVGLVVVVIAGAALYYAWSLSGQPTTPSRTPSTQPSPTAELDAAATQNDQDLTGLDAELKDYESVNPAQDNLGI